MDEMKYTLGQEVLLKGKITSIIMTESGVLYLVESNSVATEYTED